MEVSYSKSLCKFVSVQDETEFLFLYEVVKKLQEILYQYNVKKILTDILK